MPNQSSDQIKELLESQTSTHPIDPKKLEAEKSARTSFALSPMTLNNLDYLVEILGKPKKVFELLVESGNVELVVGMKGELEKLYNGQPGIQRKSFVLGKNAIDVLNNFAKEHQFKRDVLVASLIDVSALSIKKTNEDRLEKHKKIASLLDDFLTKAQEFEDKVRKIIGDDDDDLMRDIISRGMVEWEMIQSHVHGFVDKNLPVSEDL